VQLRFDLALDAGDLAAERGLATAIAVSLFCDRRARPDDELPPGQSDRRGWWADAFADAQTDPYGSHLWLISREKETDQTLARVEAIARQALAWMLDDGVASAIDISAEYRHLHELALLVTITGAGRGVAQRFEIVAERDGAFRVEHDQTFVDAG